MNLSTFDYLVVFTAVIAYLIFLFFLYVFFHYLIFGKGTDKVSDKSVIQGATILLSATFAIWYYGALYLKLDIEMIIYPTVILVGIILGILTFNIIRKQKMDFWDRCIGFIYCLFGLLVISTRFFYPEQFIPWLGIFALLTIVMAKERW